MKIGLVGKPNVGKSTFFAGATLAEAAIGDYPFTTIDASAGVGYVRVPDPGVDLGVVSTPRQGRLEGDVRLVPVQLVDVAGLVPGAHEGRGMGNRFLGDLAQADALLHIVDASGGTDAEGNPVPPGSHDPMEDVRFLEEEIDRWIDSILADGWDRLTRRVQQEGRKFEAGLAERLAGIAVGEAGAAAALRQAGLGGKRPTEISPDDRLALARALRRATKPIVVVWNKADKAEVPRLVELQAALEGPQVVASTQSELALQKGAAAGLLEYRSGADTFAVRGVLNTAQQQGLDYIRAQVLDRFGTTGVHAALETAVFGLLGRIAVFPVEDESKLTDKDGRVLPDCHLVPRGTTAKQLAYGVHTDLGEHFIRGIDCRTKRVIGADHELQDGDVVKIAANA